MYISFIGLCEWVININTFYFVYLDVEPKQRALVEAKQELQDAEEKMAVINAEINRLEVALAKIQAEQDEALAEKQIYQKSADSTAFKINLAHRFVNGLESERHRWRENITNLKVKDICYSQESDKNILKCRLKA